MLFFARRLATNAGPCRFLEARQTHKQKEADEDARREIAIKKHEEEARQIALQQRQAAKKEQERLRLEREAAERENEKKRRERLNSIDDGSRTATLKSKKAAEKERVERASKLTVDVNAEKRMSVRKSSSEELFGKKEEEWGAGKSKIWKALNPQPLAFQTAKDRSEREESKRVVNGARQGHGPDFLLLNTIAHQQVDIFDEDGEEDVFDDAAPGKPVGDGLNRTPVQADDDEDEEDEDVVDAGGIGQSGDLDGDIEAMMLKMRAKREQEEHERQEKLRAQFAAEQKAEQERLEKELAVIRAQQELERQEEERAKEKLVEEAQQQHEELVFNFAWG